MNQDSDKKPKLNLRNSNMSQKRPAILASEVSSIGSIEEIPDFDRAEDEAKFWQRHALSKVLLDETPSHVYSEDY